MERKCSDGDITIYEDVVAEIGDSSVERDTDSRLTNEYREENKSLTTRVSRLPIRMKNIRHSSCLGPSKRYGESSSRSRIPKLISRRRGYETEITCTRQLLTKTDRKPVSIYENVMDRLETIDDVSVVSENNSNSTLTNFADIDPHESEEILAPIDSSEFFETAQNQEKEQRVKEIETDEQETADNDPDVESEEETSTAVTDYDRYEAAISKTKCDDIDIRLNEIIMKLSADTTKKTRDGPSLIGSHSKSYPGVEFSRRQSHSRHKTAPKCRKCHRYKSVGDVQKNWFSAAVDNFFRPIFESKTTCDSEANTEDSASESKSSKEKVARKEVKKHLKPKITSSKSYNTDKDIYDLFGKLVASKIRKIPSPLSRERLMNDINAIIFKAQFLSRSNFASVNM